MYLYGVIGEVVNTLVCGTSMQEFDSLMAPQFDLNRCISTVLLYENYFTPYLSLAF